MKLRNLKLHIIVLVVLLVPFSLAIGQSSWEPKSDTPISGGYGEAVVGTGNYIYIVKGLYASSHPEVWKYNPSTNKWNRNPTQGLPIGAFRNGTALAWDYDRYIYALLGARYKDSNRKLFYRYDISEKRWERLSDTPGPQGAGDALTYSGYDNKIYAITGSEEHWGYFTRYDPETGSWEKLTTPWFTTDDGASLVWTGGSYLYALQGEADETSPTNSFARYHIPTDTWESRAPIPEGDCGVGDGGSLLWIGHWVPKHKDYVYALGGGCANEDGGTGFFRYNISQDKWMTLKDIPYPIGYYNGPRLGYGAGFLCYWQGAPKSWVGGGDEFYCYPTAGIHLSGYRLDDDMEGGSSGDGDEKAEAGETIELTLNLINMGQTTAKEVQAELTTKDRKIAITDSHEFYGNIPPETSKGSRGDYGLIIDEDHETSLVRFNLKIYDQNGNIWEKTLFIEIKGTEGPPKVVIYEILPNPAGPEPDNEYMKLHNKGNTTAKIGGWKLTDEEGVYIIPSGTEVEPNGFWTVYGFTYNPTGTTRGLYLRNKGETVILLDDKNNEIDRCQYSYADTNEVIRCYLD